MTAADGFEDRRRDADTLAGLLGWTVPQPAGAPPEGYVACYRAGHRCGYVTTETVSETHVTTAARCRCCGDFIWSSSHYLGGR